MQISQPLKNAQNIGLYSKFAHGSHFSGEKDDLKIRYLVVEILSKNPVLIFLGHPVLLLIPLQILILTIPILIPIPILTTSK